MTKEYMTPEVVADFVRDLLKNDESLSTLGNCRTSVLKIAQEIRGYFPRLGVQYLAYPKAEAGDGVHYSLLLHTLFWKLLVNAVAAPGFPEYIGDPKKAVPNFSQMIPTRVVN